MRHLLALVLAFAPAALGQASVPFGLAAGEARWSPERASGAAAVWDFGVKAKARGDVLVGGVDLVAGDSDNFRRTSGALPGISGGTPSYPLTVVGAFKWDTGTSAILFWHADVNNRLGVYTTGNQAYVYVAAGGVASNIPTAASSVTAGRWHWFVAVFSSASSRTIYLDTDTTGASDGNTRSVTGLTEMNAGLAYTGNGQFDGELGPLWLFNADLSGSAYSSVRAEIFKGADPERASGFQAIEHWPMEAATGASRSGSYDLTPANSPTATSKCLVVRDCGPSKTYHLRATTGAPTYDSTLFNNRGGATFTSASSHSLVCESTPITAAPLQVYVVASADTASGQRTVFSIGDKDVATLDMWTLDMSGSTGGDPLRWRAADGGTTAFAVTSSGYTAGTTHLLWANEVSDASRAARIDGANEGTDTTSSSPDNSDQIRVGAYVATIPSNYHGGSIGHVALLSTSSTDERPAFHRFYNAEFRLTLP